MIYIVECFLEGFNTPLNVITPNWWGVRRLMRKHRVEKVTKTKRRFSKTYGPAFHKQLTRLIEAGKI